MDYIDFIHKIEAFIESIEYRQRWNTASEYLSYKEGYLDALNEIKSFLQGEHEFNRDKTL